jgi:hypothetical protein
MMTSLVHVCAPHQRKAKGPKVMPSGSDSEARLDVNYFFAGFFFEATDLVVGCHSFSLERQGCTFCS